MCWPRGNATLMQEDSAGRRRQNWPFCAARPRQTRHRPAANIRSALPAISESFGRHNVALQTATVTRLSMQQFARTPASASGRWCCGVLIGNRTMWRAGPPAGRSEDRNDPRGPAKPLPAAGTTPAVQQEPSLRRTGVSSRVSPCG